MVAIMERDMDIFKILSKGPATRDAVYSAFNDKSVVYIIPQTTRYKPKVGAFFQRLWMLKKNNCLKSQRYYIREKKHFTLYALTALSAELLCKEEGYKPEAIKMVLPPIICFIGKVGIPIQYRVTGAKKDGVEKSNTVSGFDDGDSTKGILF